MTHALPEAVVTPLVTFLRPDGTPDEAATAALVEHQLQAGVRGLLALGSTGEVGNLGATARSAVLRSVVAHTAGRAAVWSGVAGLGTAEAVAAARTAQDDGADALLVLPPLFFDSSDEELADHFRAVAAAVQVPVIAYDVPPRTPRKLSVPLLRMLAEEGTLAGVKDSSGDLTTGRLITAATAHVPQFRTYAGSEITLDACLLLGYHGVVPGLANILPATAVELMAAWRAGDVDAARRAQQVYLTLLGILDPPLPGAGVPARAVAAIKVATAVVLGLPRLAVSAPFTPPTEDFIAAITLVVDRARQA